MEWARSLALKLASRSSSHIIATGTSPSGPLHIGNLREILIADQLRNQLEELGVESNLLYFVDDLDPLRRRYQFLPPDYQQHVGKPLFGIPDPWECCSSYADHFLNPFLESLAQLGVEYELLRANQLYSQGRYSQAIQICLRNSDRIRELISKLADAHLPSEWHPFMPLCSSCGKLTSTQVLGFDSAGVDYSCKCGNLGRASYAGGGKLRWRVDWPARWYIFKVTIEPFGKDLAAAGGAYSTGVEISNQIFNRPPPFPIPFEHILLKHQGKMSSSRGVTVVPGELLKLMPPAILRKLILSKRPSRHVEFDLDSIPEQIQELDDFQVPFLHLVLVAQLARDLEHALQILSRAGYSALDRAQLELKLKYITNLLADPRYARLRIQLIPEPSRVIHQLNPLQIQALNRLSELIPGRDAIQIHNLIYQVARELGLDPPKLFEAIYLVLLGTRSGPRAGWFLSSLDPDFLRMRLQLRS